MKKYTLGGNEYTLTELRNIRTNLEKEYSQLSKGNEQIQAMEEIEKIESMNRQISGVLAKFKSENFYSMEGNAAIESYNNTMSNIMGVDKLWKSLDSN